MKLKIRFYGTDTNEVGKPLTKGQSFSNKKTEYQYDEFRDSLKAVGEIDLFEQMQSVEYTRVDQILNRFLETGETSILNLHPKHNAFVDKCKVLDKMADTITELEDYKREQNLDIDINLEDIAKNILTAKGQLTEYLKKQLESVQGQTQVPLIDDKKEKENEKKNNEKSE